MDKQAPRTSEAFGSLTTVRNSPVAAMIVWLPFAYLSVTPVDTHSTHLVDRNSLRTTLVGLLEVILLALDVLALPLLVRRDTYRGLPIALIGAVAFAAVTIALVLPSPTSEGVLRCIRLAGVAGAIVTIRWMPTSTFRGAVVRPLSIGAGVQAAWALAQTFIWNNGHLLGSGYGSGRVWTRGHGAMDGAYALATFMALDIAVILSAGAFRRLRPVMWASVVLASAAVATKFGRSGVLAAGLISVACGLGWIIQHNKEYFPAAAAAIVPTVAGIAASWPGWQPRAVANRLDTRVAESHCCSGRSRSSKRIHSSALDPANTVRSFHAWA